MGKVMGSVFSILKFFKSVVYWLLRVENIVAIKQGSQVIKLLFGGKKNMAFAKKVDKFQSLLDSYCSKISNDKVEVVKKLIDNDNRAFSGMTAYLSTDKHGKDNHGLSIGVKNDKFDFGIDSKGRFKASIGLPLL